MNFPNASLQASLARRDEKLAHFEKKRIARALTVPTDDHQVKQALRQRHLPICFFGEDAVDRRQRLREAMAEEKITGQVEEQDENDPVQPDQEEQQEYFTEGNVHIYNLRIDILKHCMQRANQRLETERYQLNQGAEEVKEKELRQVQLFQKLEMQSSVVGDRRPICSITTNGSTVVTGGWGGEMAVWNIENANKMQQLEPHQARVSNVEMYDDRLLTCSADSTIRLYANNQGEYQLKSTLKQHVGRVSDARWHPFGGIISGGMDGKIIYWKDNVALFEQNSGHTSIYRISIHPDHSLISTSGLEGGIRLWDVRTSRAIMTLTRAHATEALCTDFHSNGYLLASGGSDSVMRIWDIRRGRCMKTIAAHVGIVSGLRFVDNVLVSSGYDGSVRSWGVRRTWSCLGSWSGSCRVMCVDAWAGGAVAGAWDRTWKVLMAPNESNFV